MIPRSLLIFVTLLSFISLPLGAQPVVFGQKSTSVQSGGNVQAVLQQWARTHPQLVGYLSQTGRYYLLTPRQNANPESLILALQDAFFKDVSPYCQSYGQRYLLDWQVLLAKTARETFWGASFLSNRANNYFGIRASAKEWVCESFGFCEQVTYNDPEPSPFVVFPNFESSLWMFIHTIYSPHYLERLPDGGARVADAVFFERRHGAHYWQSVPGAYFYALQLPGSAYTSEHLIYTWSEHPINNLCINCDRQSDRDWVSKIQTVGLRARG